MWRANRPFAIKPSDFPSLSNSVTIGASSKIQPLSFAKTVAPKNWLKEEEVYVDTIGNGVPDGWVRIPVRRGKDRYFDFGKPSQERISFEKETVDFNARLKKECYKMEYMIFLNNHKNEVNTDIYLNGTSSVHYSSIGMDEQNIINNISSEIISSSESEESVVMEDVATFVDEKHL
jgi:hypothetical protein